VAEKSNKREFIVFRLGNQDYCIDIMRVREIRGWTTTTAIPHAQHYMLGVINLRGAVLPILDLASRFGLPPAKPHQRSTVVVVEARAQLAGLLVESVSDIVGVSEDMIQATPEVSSALAREFVKGVIAFEGRMVSLVSTERILPKILPEAA
jgi:purine-binding chemotaxis protein CheW